MVCGWLFEWDSCEGFGDVFWWSWDVFDFGEEFDVCCGDYFLVLKFYVFVYWGVDVVEWL